MNDLTELRERWGQPEPPSQAAHSAARAALMRQISGDGMPASAAASVSVSAAAATSAVALRPRRRRGVRLAWLTGGATVTAALAVAAVLALAPGTTRPGQPAGGASGHASGQSSSQLSGQQILLAAATVAETEPATTGTYWHLKTSSPDSSGGTVTDNTWTTQDGTSYMTLPDVAGVVPRDSDGGFEVGASRLSYTQLKQLPTDPATLKAWITETFTHPRAGQPVPKVPAADLPETVTGWLVKLLWEVPAPPAVRAAAFRALAAMPNVTSLGTAGGGRGICFPASAAGKASTGKAPAGKRPGDACEFGLVIDPKTSLLVSATNFQGTMRVLKAEWTNEMPTVVQPPISSAAPSPHQ